MACISADGTLTQAARLVLSRLAAVPATAESVAAATGLPLYRVRATLRETGQARLVESEGGGAAESWHLTALGREALALDAG